MNEFAFQAEVYRDHRGMADPLQLAMRLAEMPCGAIKGNSPASLRRQVAAAARHRATRRRPSRNTVCQTIRWP